MSPSRDRARPPASRRSRAPAKRRLSFATVATVAVAVAALGAGAMYFSAGPAPSVAGTGAAPAAHAAGHAPAAMPSTPAGTAAQAQAGAPAPAGTARAPAAALNAASQAALQAFERLRGLPAGDAAIELSQQIETGITPENAAAYVQALLNTSHPAVERAAIGALARTADGELLRTLAEQYGAVPAERRGRILQVLETAANPQALPGLADIFAADTSEKRSPLVMSALYGMAHIGNLDSVQYLLRQVTPSNADYALMALERVQSPQGVEMIRAAAQGNKDSAGIAAQYLPALRQIAEASGKS